MILADKNLEETESNIIQIYKVNITINLQIFIKYSLKNNLKKHFWNGIMLLSLVIQVGPNQAAVYKMHVI